MTRTELISLIQKMDEEAIVLEIESAEKALTLWKKAYVCLSEFLEQRKDDLKCSYLVAYLAYTIWARTGEENFWMVSHDYAFYCIQSEGGDPLAKFLLLCLYFDTEQYQRAYQTEFSESDRRVFYSINQEWRIAKITEMKFGASLMCSPENSSGLANELVLSYKQTKIPEGLIPITAGKILEQQLLHLGKLLSVSSLNAICDKLYECSLITESLNLMRQRFPKLAERWAQNRNYSNNP